MRARISLGISSAMKIRMSHQFTANHVQRLLRGPVTDPCAVAEEFSFDHVRLAAVGECGIHKAHRLLRRPAGGSRDSRNADSKRGLGALTDAFGHRRCYLLADRTLLLN